MFFHQCILQIWSTLRSLLSSSITLVVFRQYSLCCPQLTHDHFTGSKKWGRKTLLWCLARENAKEKQKCPFKDKDWKIKTWVHSLFQYPPPFLVHLNLFFVNKKKPKVSKIITISKHSLTWVPWSQQGFRSKNKFSSLRYCSSKKSLYSDGSPSDIK